MKRFFFGIILIIFGVLFLLSNMQIIPYNVGDIISSYWPVLLILWGLHEFHDEMIVKGRRGYGDFFFPTLLLVIGSVLLGNNLGLFPNGSVSVWKVLLPFFIIYIGLSLLFPSRRKSRVVFHIDGDKSKDKYKGNYNWQYHNKYNNSNFFSNSKGTDSKRVLVGSYEIGNDPWVLEDSSFHVGVGEVKINLTKAHIKEGETNLDVSGCTGSITIILPADVAIDIKAQLDLGSLTILNEEHSGTPGLVTYKSLDYDNAFKKLTINVKLNIGEIILKQVN